MIRAETSLICHFFSFFRRLLFRRLAVLLAFSFQFFLALTVSDASADVGSGEKNSQPLVSTPASSSALLPKVADTSSTKPDVLIANTSEVGDLANQLMSPYCPGRTIASCPSPSARELRAQMETWASKGIGLEEITSRLEVKYGDMIYSSPREGVASWLKLMPFLIFAAFLLIFWLVARSMFKPTGGNESSPEV